MAFARLAFCLFVGLSVVALSGCKQRSEEQTRSSAQQVEPTLRLQWLGKRSLAEQTNAAGLMKIWTMEASQKLQDQTLDKLAAAPWRARQGWPTNELTGAPAELSGLLRTLLADTVQEKCYLEVRTLSNAAPEFVFAIELNPQSINTWSNNLAAVATNLLSASIEVTPSGWRARPQGSSNVLVYAAGQGAASVAWGAQAQELTDSALDALKKPLGSNNWLTAQARLPELAGLLTAQKDWFSELPSLTLAVTGYGENVLTHGNLKFPKPLPFVVQNWQIPTNLIHDPLQGFGAIQGIKPLLATSKLWTELTGGVPAPNQYFWWSQQGAPFLTYSAFPVPNATNAFLSIASNLPPVINPKTTNLMAGRITVQMEASRLSWTPFPAMAPILEPAVLPEGDFLHLAMAPSDFTNRPAPPGIISELLYSTNVVYYQREITGGRIEPGMYISQLARLVFRRAQLPFASESINWFRSAGPLLGNSTTKVHLRRPDELSFIRTSAVGFTMAELQILADWLESPQFPVHLHSSVVRLPSKPFQNAVGK